MRLPARHLAARSLQLVVLAGSLFAGAGVAGAAAPSPACQFILGFKTLHDLDPADVGACVDNQASAANGDAQQHTTKGLLAWRKADNWTAFTNGYMTWVNGPNGLASRFNDEWFEWEAYPAETDGVPVNEDPPAPRTSTEVRLGPLIHVDQVLNNCGPAAISEVLRYYGITHSQQELQSILRPADPSGMPLDAIAPYIQGIGLRALVRTDGTDRTIKSLVGAGFPVIVEQLVSAADSQLHYRPIEGYDDARQAFIAADPLLGPRHLIGYAEFDSIWTPTRHAFVVIYPLSKQPALTAALNSA